MVISFGNQTKFGLIITYLPACPGRSVFGYPTTSDYAKHFLDARWPGEKARWFFSAFSRKLSGLPDPLLLPKYFL